MMIKISICDDDLAFCRSLQQIVSQKLEALKESHTITCYYSSASFLAGPMDFDLLFLDIQMAGEDGISLARQAGIHVECELKIPAFLNISDIDWCILLANGVDNAIKATRSLPPDQGYLQIWGKQKGNFFLLTMTNSCSLDLVKPPKEGIGLSNIRAVMEKYNGTVKLSMEEGEFRLSLLFISNKPPFTPN